MVFLNYKELPGSGTASTISGLPPHDRHRAEPAGAGAGWFAFRSRVTGVYLSIITGMTSPAAAFFRNDMGLAATTA